MFPADTRKSTVGTPWLRQNAENSGQPNRFCAMIAVLLLDDHAH
jgi:hypothetical protein